MTSSAEGSLGAWLRRLPTYLYLADLLPGKRVLEIGCGVGYGAQFLANHGAARVVGVDRSLRSITDARARYRQTNLEFRCEEPGAIELDDGSFDCIFVPDGIEILRRAGVLAELRRLLVASGHLILCGSSADRRGAPGGASFYEFRDRLDRLFAPVRMVAQSPFVGFSLIEYATGTASGADDAAIDTHLDTSLLELTGGEPEASDYVAVCGGGQVRARGFTVVQVPEQGGVEAAAAAIGVRLDGLRGAGDEFDDDSGVGTSPGGAARDAILVHELRLRLDTAIADRGAAQAELTEMRARMAALNGEIEEVRAGAEALRRETAELAEGAEARASSGPSASEQIAAALSAHRDAVRSLEIAVEEGEAYAEELRADLEEASARVDLEHAGRKRAEERAARFEAELREWRTRASTAEGKLLRMARGDEPGPAAGGAGSARASASDHALSARVAELESELRQARRAGEAAGSAHAARPGESSDAGRAARPGESSDAARAASRLGESSDAGHAARPGEASDAARAGSRPGESSDAASAELAAVRAEAARQLEAVRAEAARQLEAARSESAARLEAARAETARQLEAARSESAARLEAARADAAAQLAAARLEGEQAAAARSESARTTGSEAARVDRGNGGVHPPGASAATSAAAIAALGRDVAGRVARFELELESGRSLLQQVETGLVELDRQLARESAERAPSAWAAHRDQQLRELAAEIGVKDAEIMILHVGVSALRARVREVVGEVRRTAGLARDRSTPELVQLMEQLRERVAAFDEQAESTGA